MKVVLYTTHCPACSVLERKLDKAGIKYDMVEDPNEIIKLGFYSAPVLTVDENPLGLKQACDWIDAFDEKEMEEKWSNAD